MGSEMCIRDRTVQQLLDHYPPTAVEMPLTQKLVCGHREMTTKLSIVGSAVVCHEIRAWKSPTQDLSFTKKSFNTTPLIVRDQEGHWNSLIVRSDTYDGQ